jgi:hypothetical protein
MGGLGGLSSGSESESGADSDLSKQSQQVNVARARKSKPPATPRFEEFWTIYPRKVSRLSALRAWVKNDCERIADDVLAGIQAQLPAFTARELDKVPHAATWLNAQRWTDPVELPRLTSVKAPAETWEQRDARLRREAAERDSRARREANEKARQVIASVAVGEKPEWA